MMKPSHMDGSVLSPGHSIHPTRSKQFIATLILGSGAATAAEKSSTILEEVQVTGTRIQQREDYVSPNPVVTFGQEDLQKLGIVNVSDAVTQIPQNVATFTPTTTSTNNGSFFVGSTLANLRGLNTFFGTRTLTLVDSRRFVPTTQGDAVDLNFIPSNLIQRMEVVTGGASAAYGSGAVSGVVNILLDKSLNGVKLDADYGATTHGDGQNWHLGLAGGTDLFGGRGHIIAGGEFQTSDSIDSCSDARDWCARTTAAYNNNGTGGPGGPLGSPFTPKIPGQPERFITSGLRFNQVSTTGVIFRGPAVVGGVTTYPSYPTTTSQFNAAGTGVVPFNIGTPGVWNTFPFLLGNTIGGDGEPIFKNQSLFPEIERKTAYAHMNYDFTDSFTGFIEASYGQVEGFNQQGNPSNGFTVNCLSPANGFAQGNAALTGALQANVNNGFSFVPGLGCNTFGMTAVQKDWSSQIVQNTSTDTKVTRAVVGLNGKFGGSSWSWDAYYQFGKTERDQIGENYRTSVRYQNAIDAVVNSSGQVVCRVTRDGIAPQAPGIGAARIAQLIQLAEGCQPLNVFGSSSASAAALAYAFGDLTEHDSIRQDVLAASVTGELWQGWGAGALAAAAGVEYRIDKMDNTSGNLPDALRTDFALQYGDAFGGETTVTEGFVELEMPLLRAKPGAQLLTLNGAVRTAQYENEATLGINKGQSGTQDINTWKLASVWDPVNWLRFRGSYSTDVRAANFRELYFSMTLPEGSGFGNVTNPWRPPGPPGSQTDPATVFNSGDANLDPEKAKTTTVGFVLSPGGWAESMHFSADYYKIELEGGIQSGQVGVMLNECQQAYAGNPGRLSAAECDSLITFADASRVDKTNIVQAIAPYFNAQPYRLRGIDFAWDYLLPLSSLFESSKGNLAFRLTASRALEMTATVIPFLGTPVVTDVVGQTGTPGSFQDFGAPPDWSANMSVSYLSGPLVLTASARYVSEGYLDITTPWTGPEQAGYNPARTGSVTSNTIPSYTNFSLNGSYDFSWFGLAKTQMFASVNNVFDKDPPFSSGGGFGMGVNASYFDTLGRTYRVGVRLQF